MFSFKERLKKIYRRIIIFLLLFLALLLLALVALFSINHSQQQLMENLGQGQKTEQNKIIAQLFGQASANLNKDQRVALVESFLQDYQSPLVPYAQRIVTLADRYQIHYGLIPAIGLIESGLCKTAPADSFNCWGWGIYGKKVTRFSSYDEAIERVTRGLRQEYYDRGLDTPEKIMQSYNPTNHNNWLGKVKSVLKQF